MDRHTALLPRWPWGLGHAGPRTSVPSPAAPRWHQLTSRVSMRTRGHGSSRWPTAKTEGGTTVTQAPLQSSLEILFPLDGAFPSHSLSPKVLGWRQQGNGSGAIKGRSQTARLSTLVPNLLFTHQNPRAREIRVQLNAFSPGPTPRRLCHTGSWGRLTALSPAWGAERYPRSPGRWPSGRA